MNRLAILFQAALPFDTRICSICAYPDLCFVEAGEAISKVFLGGNHLWAGGSVVGAVIGYAFYDSHSDFMFMALEGY